MNVTESTVGAYLAERLSQIGMQHFFTVPGDYNLILLDELLKNERLKMVSCCNELNAGYAADGYARATGGPSAVVVTYSVGGLSLLNAIAGAYAEDLPVIAISGSPNTNSTAEYEVLHHTLGDVDYDYQRQIYERVTAAAVSIQHPAEAPAQIDRALDLALRQSKPVYLEVACNIANATVCPPHPRQFATTTPSDSKSLKSAVEHASDLLSGATRPVLLAGVKIRAARAESAFHRLAQATGYAVAAMPNAKSFFDEQHASYMGIYWGPVSSPGCAEIVESADVAVMVGPVFSDYTTSGHSTMLDPGKIIEVRPDSVIIARQTYSDLSMVDFLDALSTAVQTNDGALQAFKRIEEPTPQLPPSDPQAALTTRYLFAEVERLLGSASTLIAETGDSWFNGMRLSLPSGSRFEIQMQYGSIGWSVGATLGYCLGAPNRKVLLSVGDGSFQLTAQEVSTMLRYGLKPIILLINNGGYTIEVEIHDGPYNSINNWRYAALVEAFNGTGVTAKGYQARTNGELSEALQSAVELDGLALIEVAIDRDDCSKTLLEWGTHVARNNGRPPKVDW